MAKLLTQWLELTQAEGSAIQTAAWSRLNEIQSSKIVLQKSLDEARKKLSGENPIAAPANQNPFRAEIGRLLSLEERNRELLAVQLNRARAQQESLDQAYRNLRKIQRSYIRKQDPNAWQCYS